MKLFGATQREVVGDSIGRLFPEPLCNYAQEVLDRCSSLTEASGASTVLLGRHRQGYAVPLTTVGVEVGGSETSYTFRAAPVVDEFLLFMSDTLRVTAVSQETMTMLGVRRPPSPYLCRFPRARAKVMVVVVAGGGDRLLMTCLVPWVC